MLTFLMIIDALVAIMLILVIIGQEPKSTGMGGLDGSSGTVFGSKARGMDALLAKLTVALAVCFAVTTMIIAKMTA